MQLNSKPEDIGEGEIKSAGPGKAKSNLASKKALLAASSVGKEILATAAKGTTPPRKVKSSRLVPHLSMP